jgi:hypothetical protein
MSICNAYTSSRQATYWLMKIIAAVFLELSTETEIRHENLQDILPLYLLFRLLLYPPRPRGR